MTLAEEFAQLVASSDFHAIRPLPNSQPLQKVQSHRSQTVYSVGEAISRKERSNNAKLAASPI